MYESDITKFIRELHEKKPTLEAEQARGRALLWDCPQDAEELREQAAARVQQQAYVYQTKV